MLFLKSIHQKVGSEKKLSHRAKSNLIGAIIGVEEKWAPPWGQGLTVYAIAVVLRRDEGLACHHIQHRLVLASGDPQTCIKQRIYFTLL